MFLLTTTSWILPSRFVVQAAVSCTTDADCEAALLKGSICSTKDNTCTNPFHHSGGCLKSLLPQYNNNNNNNKKNWHKIRVCHSDDPPDAAAMGYCQSPSEENSSSSSFQDSYMEVRVLSLNWESTFFQAWILQILLSEVLGVPVSIETGIAGLSTDFYDVHSRMDYGDYDEMEYSELQLSADILDCRRVKVSLGGDDDEEEGGGGEGKTERYRPCGHVVPEVWEAPASLDTGIPGTGPYRELGVLGGQHWHVPKFTAQKDPSLTSYLGLIGQENRHKLASIFKRPTTWKDYCDQVSIDGCATEDDVATRAPLKEEEETRMFAEGEYTGHFRFTDANNCTKNPLTCTGHFADYPCDWSSYSIQQLYHLDIALESNGVDATNGYTYSQLVDIWLAANATKSDVMMIWWQPESLFQNFLGTDAEFVQVDLPTPTKECEEARFEPFCSGTDVSTSDPKGACDYNVQSIKRLIGDGLYQATMDPNIPEALRSPAYETIENFRITSLELGEIFNKWFERDTDPSNFDPRYATCQWVVENLDHVLSFIPETYPRTVQNDDPSKEVLCSVAVIIACIAVTITLVTALMVHQKKDTKVMFYAQTEYLFSILAGLLLVSISAIILAVPPTDATCVSIIWLTNIGYAVHLGPLVTRIFAINWLANTGKQMQRVRLSGQRLFGVSGIIVGLVSVFLLLWTLLDAPEKSLYYVITGRTTEFDETVVASSDFCQSESPWWQATSLVWQAGLLFPGAIIAMVVSSVREDMNDTREISFLLYSHVAFLIVRAAVYLLLDESLYSDMMSYQSLLLSLDSITAIFIYIIPKVLTSEEVVEKEILPDIFLHSSIMVADVRGFSAWSSAREPVQVFKLLETLYETFDRIAEKDHVFKVETVRDCYVAATGIPDPQPKHATIMAKFAVEMIKTMDHVSKKLELMFGPDTGDLTLRVGVHSGPVTGGFLKGKGARFQLFGDTMTTANIIQCTGQSNRVHLSDATANLLIDAGLSGWVQKRDGKVQTEEKGELETWWLTKGIKSLGGFDDQEASSSIANTFGNSIEFTMDMHPDQEMLDSEERWIEWNVEVLAGVLRQILAQRARAAWLVHLSASDRDCSEDTALSGVIKQLLTPMAAAAKSSVTSTENDSIFDKESSLPIEEVAEIIELPEFDKRIVKRLMENEDIELDAEVLVQLKMFVTAVAKMYRNNPFHNFAHASYVVMAVSKYMNRIVAASEVDVGFDADRQQTRTHAALHDHTYGITSDPLTRFACVFSALIHDIDHPGVPNPQLIQEDKTLAKMYNSRSVAEQNSLDLAWSLLMETKFRTLRTTICAKTCELRRFRQLVVNSVMATDLGDKALKDLRNGRWERAFADNESVPEEDPRSATNRKATIVIEHLIQAADIAHTCQHWGIYRKWNERLFQECYKAWRDGRAEKNPADGWYKGEMGFYDFYIIPLAKKLRDCGVFGPTSDENLDYAKKNRAMWEKEGEGIVAEMLAKAEKDYAADHPPVEPETSEAFMAGSFEDDDDGQVVIDA